MIRRETSAPSRWGEFGATLLLVVAAYFAAGRLGAILPRGPEGVLPVWPAAGVGLAAVLLGGRRMAPAVAIGALLTALSLGEATLPALIAAAARTAEPVIGVELLRRVGFRDGLTRTHDVIAFVGLAAVLGTAVGASIGLLSILAAGSVSAAALPTVWRDWWLGDFTGVLIVGSAILVVAGVPLAALRTRVVLEGLALLGAVAVASFALMRVPGSAPYLVLPLLFLLALAYRQPGATLGALVASTVAVVLTARGHSPFPGGSIDSELVRAQTFVCVGSVTALLVAASQSERKLAERAVDRLAESESALAEAQRLARLGSFDTDLVNGRAIWSAELYRIFGQDPASMPPGWESWRQCVHHDDRDRVESILRELAAGRVPSSVVHRIVRPDGQVRTVEARFRFERDGDGVPVRIVGTCQDVTAIKLAEERFRSLFDDAPYPIVVLSRAGEITLSNLQAQAMFGYTAAELTGRAVDELVADPAGGRAWYELGESLLSLADIELRARRRDGSEFPVEVSLTPLASEDGVLISAAIRDVTEVRATEESLTHEARHDALTGLPNRVLFLERLELALARGRRSARPLAVVFLDLDDFKVVNDTRGHEAGDRLLVALTRRLGATVRHGDTLARLGGDEFVVLFEGLVGEDHAVELAQRVVDVALDPVLVDGAELVVSLSAGVVFVDNPDSVSANGVLRDADAAMYNAKARGKGRVALFDAGLRERLLERVAIESALREAVPRGELELHYQPVVELDGRRVVAIEALLRWRHPMRGLLAPAEFMGVAESTGLIGEIGEWVIEEACRQAAAWRELGSTDQPVPVSVNVSAHQLTQFDLADAVERILGETGLDPGLLVLEVTESALLEDVAASRRELLRVKELGVRLVVDDFGTGYSSLSVLRNLMVDGLKLDPSFVQALELQPDDGSMVDAVLSMAGALDAEVTAEGVETWSQARALSRLGCDYAQGFLFARPGPASDLTPLLQSAARRDERLAG